MNYRPYGDSIEVAKDDVGYTGHKFDTDLGLSYMQARYYDPVIGRFYSNDPVGTVEHLSTSNGIHGFNRYTYANNNPYRYTDPTGGSSLDMSVNRPPGVTIKQHRAAAGKASGVVARRNPYVMAASIAVEVLTPVLNESVDDWEADYEDWANGNSDDTTEHGKERNSRGVDKDKTRKNGEKFRDTESGGTVYVDGNNVVIDGENGNMTSWGDQTEKETTGKVESGKWEPIE